MASPVLNFLPAGAIARMADEQRKLDRDAELARQAKAREELSKAALALHQEQIKIGEQNAAVSLMRLQKDLLEKQLSLQREAETIQQETSFLEQGSRLKRDAPDYQEKLGLLSARYPLGAASKAASERIKTWDDEHKLYVTAAITKERHDADKTAAVTEATAAGLKPTEISTSSTGNTTRFTSPKQPVQAGQLEKRFDDNKNSYLAAQAKAREYRAQGKEVPPDVVGTMEYRREQMRDVGQRLGQAVPDRVEEIKQTIADADSEHLSGLQSEHDSLQSKLTGQQQAKEKDEIPKTVLNLNRVKREINTLVQPDKRYQLIDPATNTLEPLPAASFTAPTPSIALPEVTKPVVQPLAAPVTISNEPQVTAPAAVPAVKPVTLQPLPDEHYQSALDAIQKGAPMERVQAYLTEKGFDPSRLKQPESAASQ